MTGTRDMRKSILWFISLFLFLAVVPCQAQEEEEFFEEEFDEEFLDEEGFMDEEDAFLEGEEFGEDEFFEEEDELGDEDFGDLDEEVGEFLEEDFIYNNFSWIINVILNHGCIKTCLRHWGYNFYSGR